MKNAQIKELKHKEISYENTTEMDLKSKGVKKSH